LRLHVLSLTVLAVLAAAPAAAQDLSIENEPDGVRLNLDDVPVEQAVDALSKRFNFTVKILRPSGVRLNGSRSGNALDLLNWVLSGHDRAIFMADDASQERISRVVVFGPSGGAPATPPPAASSSTDPGFHEDGAVEDIPPDEGAQDSPPMDGGISDYAEPYDPNAPQ
jgi:hypothetical protein